MENLKSVFRANLFQGLLVLVPFAIIFLLLLKIVEILEAIAKPLGLTSITSTVLVVFLGLLVLLCLCLVVGAIVRTRMGSWSFDRVEEKIFKHVPGYEIISNLLRGFVDESTVYPAAMVRLYQPGTAVLGFVMEENENGTVTVFVPSAPTLSVGSLHIVDRERVTILETGAKDLTECVSQWGIGSGKILGSIRT